MELATAVEVEVIVTETNPWCLLLASGPGMFPLSQMNFSRNSSSRYERLI